MRLVWTVAKAWGKRAGEGGSLSHARGDTKPNWIQLLVQKGATRAVLVPGLCNNKRCKIFGTQKRITGRNTWTQAEIRLWERRRYQQQTQERINAISETGTGGINVWFCDPKIQPFLEWPNTESMCLCGKYHQDLVFLTQSGEARNPSEHASPSQPL